MVAKHTLSNTWRYTNMHTQNLLNARMENHTTARRIEVRQIWNRKKREERGEGGSSLASRHSPYLLILP